MPGALDTDSKLPGPRASSVTDPTWALDWNSALTYSQRPPLRPGTRGPGGPEDWWAAGSATVLANTHEGQQGPALSCSLLKSPAQGTGLKQLFKIINSDHKSSN